MLTPKNIIKGTNSDGTKFTAEEWDYQKKAGNEGAYYGILLVIGLVLVSVVSPLLAVIYILKFDRRQIIPIIGLVVGFYFLLDYKNVWFIRMALNICFEKSTVLIIMILNIVSTIAHIILLFTSPERKTTPDNDGGTEKKDS